MLPVRVILSNLPAFQEINGILFLIFLQTAMGYCIKLDVKKVIAHHEAQEKQQQSGLAMIQVLIEKNKIEKILF